jgi:hypothetical protein
MEKYFIEESEKTKILSMHKALMKEQSSKEEVDEQDLKGGINSEEDMLRKAIKAGCLKSGKLLTNNNRSKFVYRATTKSGKEVDFSADMSYKFKDGSGSGKWACPQLATVAAAEVAAQQTAAQTSADNESKIQTELKKNWKRLETLRAEGVDLTTLDKVYDTQVIGNVTLYRPKGSSTTFTPGTSTADFNREQLEFVGRFEDKGYKLNPTRIEQSTMVKVTDKELGAPADLFPNGLVMWYNPNAQSQISRRDDSVLSNILDNQSVDRQACRKNVDDYFKSFQRKNSIVIDPATINKAKRIVQACKDEHYGKWGVAGGGNRLDNYLDILAGNKEGGPTSYGDDSIWRIK